MWGEPSFISPFSCLTCISTHSPRVGRTRLRPSVRGRGGQFQLTRPVWGEPRQDAHRPNRQPFQLTRPVWGEPLPRRVQPVGYIYFNSLAPCGANRVMSASRRDDDGHFNSLAPCGANRRPCPKYAVMEKFQLTRPVWGEPKLRPLLCRFASFQLTRPVWGEPIAVRPRGIHREISTHSPRVGRTGLGGRLYGRNKNFNSLAPCGANHLM